MTMDEIILQAVKDDLHITYTLDESSQRRLKNAIEDGMAYIKAHGDPAATFGPGTYEARLLSEYVLRAESGALESFRRDFGAELRASQMGSQADRYAEAMGYAES